jgi:hypothetical protein
MGQRFVRNRPWGRRVLKSSSTRGQLRVLPLAVAVLAIIAGVEPAARQRRLAADVDAPPERAIDAFEAGVEPMVADAGDQAEREGDTRSELRPLAWSECASVDDYRGTPTADWHGDWPLIFELLNFRLLRLLWVDAEGNTHYHDESGQGRSEDPKLGFPATYDCEFVPPKALAKELRDAILAVGRCDDTWHPIRSPTRSTAARPTGLGGALRRASSSPRRRPAGWCSTATRVFRAPSPFASCGPRWLSRRRRARSHEGPRALTPGPSRPRPRLSA